MATTLAQSDVVCAGHICLDITPHIPDVGFRTVGEIFRPGKLVNVENITLHPGGPVANSGLAFAKMGVSTAFIAKLGQDEFGKLTLEHLAQAGDVSGVRVLPGQTTAYSIVLAPPGIDRIFLHNPGLNDTFVSDDIDFASIKSARLFHFGYPPIMKAVVQNDGYELVKIFRLAKESGVTTSLDMSLPDPDSASGKLPWRAILERVLPYVDVFAPSIEEATFCLEPEFFKKLQAARPGPDFIAALPIEKYSEFGNLLLEMGCRIVVIKAAQRGIYLRTTLDSQLFGIGSALRGNFTGWANREIWCPTFYIPKVVNATGAGDVAIAGFLAAMLRDFSVERALKTAASFGAQNLTAADAISGLNSWSETQAQLDGELAKLNDFEIETPGWYWDKSQKLWFGPNDKMIIQ